MACRTGPSLGENGDGLAHALSRPASFEPALFLRESSKIKAARFKKSDALAMTRRRRAEADRSFELVIGDLGRRLRRSRRSSYRGRWA